MGGDDTSKPAVATAENTAGEQRARGKPFTRGKSGNAAGKPKGARNRVSLAVEALLEGEHVKLTRAAIDRALGGNTEALRICLDRIAPVRKDRAMSFDLPSITTVADIGTAQEAIARQVADGVLTPGEGVQVSALIEARRRTVETVDLEKRIAELEARQNGGTGE